MKVDFVNENWCFFLVFLDFILKNICGVVLGEVLRVVIELFNDVVKVCFDVKNVLVVVIDKKFDSRGEDLKKEVMKIWFIDIKVIVVVFGDELDKDEFDILIFD